MRTPTLVLASVFATAVAVSTFHPAAGAQSAPSRIIDRTLVCSIVQGNPREITVEAWSGTRKFGDRSQWQIRPNASFFDPRATAGYGTSRYQGAAAWVSAGWPPLDAEALTFSPRCARSSANVPLSTKGLTGGSASPTSDRYDCVVPRQILVRVRGLFRSPTTLRLTTRYGNRLWRARGAIVDGVLAVRALDGGSIALATVASSGKARLVVGESCGPSA
jgi:hypothetical protein